MTNQIKINEEFRPEIVVAVCQKIKTLSLEIIRNKEEVGENSYLDIISAYESLKSAIQYIEIGE